jgi:amidase
MATFIIRLDAPPGDGLRLAVKDLIDMEGLPTTAGCRALADRAVPAAADAPCLAGARAAGARIVGKVNLHELAFGATGINPWFGTPVNPQDPGTVPGGSSSGSAVAVGSDEADIALGSDTAGSVRIPSACCATAGLKTTHGRVPLDGVWPLAASLDTIGPMARDVAGLVTGMELLEPGFRTAPDPPTVVGRVRLENTDPAIDDAIDAALAAWGVEVVAVEVPGWAEATSAGLVVTVVEAWANDRELYESAPEGIGDSVRLFLEVGKATGEDSAAWADAVRPRWRAELGEVLERVQLLALPTLVVDPPSIDDPDVGRMTDATVAVNLAGNPALALPVPRPGRLAASLQLVGPLGGEELLLAAGREVEAAVAG